MAIRIDSAVNWLPESIRDKLERDVSHGQRGPISDSILLLNSELLRRQETIDWQRRQIDALKQRNGELLEALKALVDVSDNYGLFVNEARAVIAKATG